MSQDNGPVCSEVGLPIPEPMSDATLAAIGKAIGHPARLRILHMFEEGRCQTASDVVDRCDLAQSTVSEHLRILREADLLFARREGTRVWYCLRRSVLREYASAVRDLSLRQMLESI